MKQYCICTCIKHRKYVTLSEKQYDQCGKRSAREMKLQDTSILDKTKLSQGLWVRVLALILKLVVLSWCFFAL